MNLIVNKYDHVILSITDDIVYDDNGNPVDNSIGIGYFKDQVEIIENVTIPTDSDIIPHKFCYTTESSFYKNENYTDINIADKLNNIESNIDYLMLLNDTTEE